MSKIRYEKTYDIDKYSKKESAYYNTNLGNDFMLKVDVSNKIILTFIKIKNKGIDLYIYHNHFYIVKRQIKINKPKTREEFGKKIKNVQKYFTVQHEWNEFKNDLRKLLYTPVSKVWEDVLGDEIVEWAYNYIAKIIRLNKLDCCDNYRVAQIGKSSQVRRYFKQKNDGCCGFFDEKVYCPIDGKYYLIGFNYGH